MQLKGAMQDHPDDTGKVDGAELHQVKIVASALEVEEQSMLTKFDIEDNTGVVNLKIWLNNGNGVFMAERRAACRHVLFLSMSWLYSPIRKSQNTKRRAFREALHLCVRF
jgi:hypothetical protein